LIDIQRKHWFLAFSLALGVHLAVFIFGLGQPGREPVYRSGSFYHEKDKSTRGGSSVFVKLGKAGASAADNFGKSVGREKEQSTGSNAIPSQGSIEDRDAREDGGNKVAEAIEFEAANEKDDALKAESKSKDAGGERKPKAGSKFSANQREAKSTSTGKPKPPELLPELESLARRFSVQGPVAAADAKEADSEPPPATKTEASEKRGGGQSEETAVTRLISSFTGPGRAGTASGNKYGDVRYLNYKDQVLLWIKAHGGYPHEARMFNLNDTVTVHFAIGRNGKILYHYLAKSSQYHLLNRAAERMMERSSPVPPFPPEVREDKLTFTVKVDFDPYFES
jgi:TonB family protein